MEKTGIGIVGLVFAAVAAVAAETSTPKGFTDDLDAAMQRAKANGHNILAVFSGSDWCIWCKRLEKEILSKDAFIQTATNAYELVFIDNPMDEKVLSETGRKNNRRLTEKYGIQGFPTVLVLNADGEVVAQPDYKMVGPQEYLSHINAARDASLSEKEKSGADGEGEGEGEGEDEGEKAGEESPFAPASTPG